jgi:hypothetical protein
MNTDSKKTETKQCTIPSVMRSFSTDEIESIIFEQVGDYPKKLKHIKRQHPQMNVHGLIMINREYYEWVYVNGA